MKEIRNKLEQQIIAAVVMDSTAIDALQFLTEKNFENHNHIRLWSTIREMEGKMPIDISTLSYRVHVRYGKDLLQYLIDITNQVASSVHVMEHAAILVQVDLKEKFINVLRILAMSSHISDSDRALIAETLKEVEIVDEPIWSLAIAVQSMFESKKVSDIAIKEIALFNQNVNIKMDMIRKKSHQNYVIHALSKMCKTDLQRMYFNQLVQSL